MINLTHREGRILQKSNGSRLADHHGKLKIGTANRGNIRIHRPGLPKPIPGRTRVSSLFHKIRSIKKRQNSEVISPRSGHADQRKASQAQQHALLCPRPLDLLYDPEQGGFIAKLEVQQNAKPAGSGKGFGERHDLG